MGGEKIICRLFIRHRCNRGDSCPFYHPGYNLTPDSPTLTWLNFCKEFKMGRCFQDDCRFFHITREEEDTYRLRKDIAPTLLEQAMRKALLLDVALTGTRGTCKGFLQGGCSMPSCPFRHITRHEFANEVLNTLRNEFEIVLGSSGSDTVGMQSLAPVPGNTMANPQIRGTPLRTGMGQSPMPDTMNKNEDSNELMKKLEEENLEIYRALDPNQKASNLEEIRARLLTLQAALQWKDENNSTNTPIIPSTKGGFIDDGLPPGMAVVDYGHTDQSIEQTNIDYMRRRDPVPMEPMYGRNDGFQGNPPVFNTDNYDNAPMDLDQGDHRPDKESECKLFIGGLDGGTETKDLENYFSRYGEIIDAVVMRDKKNNKSRGFGFVTFLKSYMAENAGRDAPHRIDGKTVDTKFAKPRPAGDRGGSPKRSERSRRASSPDRRENVIPKLFVGGLSDEITTDILTSYFQRYGRIVDAVSMQDPTTKRPRGFGFVEFDEESSLQDVLSDAPHSLFGCNVTVDRSMPRDSSKRNDSAPSAGEPCKMFVGGLSFSTSERTLKDYFARFGEVVDVNIHRDNKGLSKGYGFVTYSEPMMVDDAHESGPHEVDGRRVDTGYASQRSERKDKFSGDKRREPRRNQDRPGPGPGPGPEPVRSKFEFKGPKSSDDGCKMYIGGIPKSLNEDDLEEYFMQFGDIKKTEIKPLSQHNNKGYGFVTFEEPQMVENALNNAPHEINGFSIDIGHAVTKGGKDKGRREDGERRNSESFRDDNRKNRNPRENNPSNESYQPCKLFVGSLSFDATEETLYDYFCKYGEIKDTKVNTDKRGVSKGFGFVTFVEEISVQEALDDGPHEIDGRQVNLGSAIAKGQDRKDGDRRRQDRNQEPLSLSSKRKAEKRSHLD